MVRRRRPSCIPPIRPTIRFPRSPSASSPACGDAVCRPAFCSKRLISESALARLSHPWRVTTGARKSRDGGRSPASSARIWYSAMARVHRHHRGEAVSAVGRRQARDRCAAGHRPRAGDGSAPRVLEAVFPRCLDWEGRLLTRFGSPWPARLRPDFMIRGRAKLQAVTFPVRFVDREFPHHPAFPPRSSAARLARPRSPAVPSRARVDAALLLHFGKARCRTACPSGRGRQSRACGLVIVGNPGSRQKNRLIQRRRIAPKHAAVHTWYSSLRSSEPLEIGTGYLWCHMLRCNMNLTRQSSHASPISDAICACRVTVADRGR